MGLYFVIFVGIVFCPSCYSLLDWFNWKQNDPFQSTKVPLLTIPFEELGPEDKFLVEANKITGLKLSQLDACQHKLIMKIKTSCGKLSDEDLSKLSVNLLNCQSDVEGRKIFPCTEEMSLRDCTREMDVEIWNSYHIISNRARAVCYAARQEQFRALAEITVNKLVSTAQTHLELLTSLNVNQEKLEKATEIALARISRSQHDVLSTYSRLRRLESEFAASLIKDKLGLEQLGALVDNGENQIVRILAEFRNALEEAKMELKNQKEIKAQEHVKVLDDLSQSRNLIQDIVKQLGNARSSNEQNFLKVSSNFNDTVKFFSNMNQSLNEIYTKLSNLEKLTTDKASMILTFVGSSGENIDSAIIFFLHFGSLLFGMIICSFLNLPTYLRAVTLSAGATNCYLFATDSEYAIELPILYLSLAAVVCVDFISVLIYLRLWKKRLTRNAIKPSRNGMTRGQYSNGILDKTPAKVNDWLTVSGKYSNGLTNGTLLDTPASLDERNLEDHQSKDEVDNGSVTSRGSVRFRHSGSPALTNVSGSESHSSRRKYNCIAIRVNGLKCKLPALSGEEYCRLHRSR